MYASQSSAPVLDADYVEAELLLEEGCPGPAPGAPCSFRDDIQFETPGGSRGRSLGEHARVSDDDG